jgi:transcriptional regulator with XRE-family HTH domain
MSAVSQNLGNRIRTLRTSLGMSQEELAFKASISAAHLGQIERALKVPTVDTLDKIANALDISMHELFLFDSPVTKSDTTTMNKIIAQISPMSEQEQAELLKIIKNIKSLIDLKQ